MRAKLLSMTMACMVCIAIMNVDATGVYQMSNANVAFCSEETIVLNSRTMDNIRGMGTPIRKSPVLIPEVTKNDHTLHFITPCTGLTLQLVQDDEVCYETVITSDYLEIPSSITGVYELQILSGNYVFYAEVEL